MGAIVEALLNLCVGNMGNALARDFWINSMHGIGNPKKHSTTTRAVYPSEVWCIICASLYVDTAPCLNTSAFTTIV